MAVTLNRVEIVEEGDALGLGHATIVVRPYYDGVDRAEGSGIGLNASDRKLALRLKAAIEAGAAYPITGIRTDALGKTYAATTMNVIGRHLNADLRRLGF